MYREEENIWEKNGTDSNMEIIKYRLSISSFSYGALIRAEYCYFCNFILTSVTSLIGDCLSSTLCETYSLLLAANNYVPQVFERCSFRYDG